MSRPVLFVLLFVGCTSAKPDPSHPAPAPSASASASVKTVGEAALCDRVCATQAKCGAPKEPCVRRCLPIARVLQSDVVEAMVACVEKKTPPTCDNTEAGQKARGKLVGMCVLEATEIKRSDAGANVDLFANAHCDRTKECGVEGTFVKTECLGRGRDSIRKTEEEGSGSLSLYGALRPSSVDAVVTCLKSTPCDKRSPDAATELSGCLDNVLASAATP
jgi:hypothetical protein